MIITIDGPSSSGKSSVAKLIAEKLGISHLNSGLLFRALAYILITDFAYNEENLVDVRPEDIEKLFLKGFEYENGKSKIIYDKRDLTPFLKSRKIDQAASILSTVSFIRQVLLNFQRKYAKLFSIVVDGRDSGSIVFPHANLKIFLTANPEIRAQRWRQAQLEKGTKHTPEKALEEINIRDERDTNRNIAPLTVAKGAIIIDNSQMTLEETVAKIMGKILRD